MFENEHTLHTFMTEKAEGQFHDKYEKALDQVRTEFGRKYSMIIGGKEVNTSQTITHTSPTDTRIVLGRLPDGSTTHIKQAITVAKRAFEVWRKAGWQQRVK